MPVTIKDIRKNKRFLEGYQEMGLIGLISGKVSRSQKEIIAKMIKYSLYSLEDAGYWDLIEVIPDGVVLSSKAKKNTLKDAREHIISQYRG